MIEQYLPFVLFVAVATSSPGGATAFATASGVHFGVKGSLRYIGGVGIGMASMAVASALGLAALLLAVPVVETAIRSAGTAYLLYLAWQIATSGQPASGRPRMKPIGVFGAAAMVSYNPKAWAVTLAASSSIANLAATPAVKAAVVGTTFLVFALASMTLWCALGHVVGRMFSSVQQWRLLNAALGILLVASIVPMWL